MNLIPTPFPEDASSGYNNLRLESDSHCESASQYDANEM